MENPAFFPAHSRYACLSYSLDTFEDNCHALIDIQLSQHISFVIRYSLSAGEESRTLTLTRQDQAILTVSRNGEQVPQSRMNLSPDVLAMLGPIVPGGDVTTFVGCLRSVLLIVNPTIHDAFRYLNVASLSKM